MFNTNFNLTTAVNELPLALRKNALLSLVGSLNAKIFGIADKAVMQLQADGYVLEELKELNHRELVGLFDSLDDTSTHHHAVMLASLAQEWRDMLHKVSENPNLGLMSGTITMMTGVQKIRVVSGAGSARLAAIGEVRTPEQRKESLQAKLAQDQARADERSRRTGFIEFIIDRVITPCTDEETEHYSEIDDITKEQLCNKFLQSLQKSKQTAIMNVETETTWGDSLGEADIIFLRNSMDGFVDEMYGTRPQVVNPDMPSKNAYRVTQPA